MYKAIDVGCGKGDGFIKDFMHEYFPEWDGQIEITRLDGDPEVEPDILHDLMTPMPEELKGQFDFVYMSHVLEHIPWQDSLSVAKEVSSLVKEGGYFLILVPNLEWAAKEILRGNFTTTLMVFLYGTQTDRWQYHYCGFTKPALKVLADRIEMSIYAMKESPILTIAAGRVENGLQHELLLRKVTKT